MQLTELLNEGQALCSGINSAYNYLQNDSKENQERFFELSEHLSMSMYLDNEDSTSLLGTARSDRVDNLDVVVNLLNALKLKLTCTVDLELLVSYVHHCEFSVRYVVYYDDTELYEVVHHFDDAGVLVSVDAPDECVIIVTFVERINAL